MTLPTSQYIAGLRIAGIGDAANDTSEATVWATRLSRPLISRLSLTLWRPDCLVELPQTADSSVDPWASRYETGPMSFDLALSEVGHIIPVQGWEPVANVAQTALASAATIRLTSGALADTIVYCGDETIKLGAATDLGEGVWQYDVFRAWHGSRAHEQAEGEPVFLRPPEWRGRKMELLLVRGDSSTPRILWTGYLEGIEASNHGTRVTLQGRAILDAIAQRDVNVGAPDINASGGISADLFTQARLVGQVPYVSRVRKQWTGPRKMCVQVQDSLWVVDEIYPDTLDLSQATLAHGLLDLKVDEAKDESFGALKVIEGGVWELCVVSRELDERFGAVSFTSPLPTSWRYHPAAIAFALLTSTPAAAQLVDPLEADILGAAWGLSVWEWIDVEAWADLINATPEIQIDQLILGWDGAPVPAIATVIDVLLRPYGLFLTRSEEGLLAVARLISPTILDLCEAGERQIPIVRPKDNGQLGWSYEIASAVSQISAEVGSVPWSPDPSSITVSPFGRTPRGAQLADNRVYTYDFRTRTKASVAGFLDGDRGDQLTLMLFDRAVRASWTLPRLKITALDSRLVGPGVRYDLGAFVTLASPMPPAPVFRLPTGEQVDPTDPEYETYFLGQIMSAKPNLPNQTWELELLLVAWRTGAVARYRAPSALIEAYYEGGDIELEIWEESEFGGSTSDATGFAVGDEVAFYERDGEAVAGAHRTVIDKSGRILVIDSAADEDVSGKIVKLADSTAYSNTDNILGAECSDRPWVYFADEDDLIARSVGTEPADIYG